MAENSINVTEGSGKRLHTFNRTIAAVDVHDEVMLLGEPYLAGYMIDISAVSVATANDHVLQIMAGGTLPVYVRRIRVWQSGLATTAALAQWAIFRLSSAGTGGTVIGLDPLDTTDAAAGATAMTLPTAKGTEATRLWQGTLGFIQTVSTGGSNPLLLDLDFDKMLRSKAIRIAAGTTNGIALKNVSATAAATVYVVAEVSEAGF